MSDDLDRELQIMPKCLGCPNHNIQTNTCRKNDCDKKDDDE